MGASGFFRHTVLRAFLRIFEMQPNGYPTWKKPLQYRTTNSNAENPCPANSIHAYKAISISCCNPTQSLQELIDKAYHYFGHGVKSYWLVILALKNIYVFSGRETYQISNKRNPDRCRHRCHTAVVRDFQVKASGKIVSSRMPKPRRPVARTPVPAPIPV